MPSLASILVGLLFFTAMVLPSMLDYWKKGRELKILEISKAKLRQQIRSDLERVKASRTPPTK